MTLGEKKTKMAVRLGLPNVCQNGFYGSDPNCRNLPIPDYFYDERTRKDILAVMTNRDKSALCLAVHPYSNSASAPEYMIAILELTQPDFFELAGQAMNLWEK